MAKRIFPSLFILLLALSCLEEPDCIGLNNNIVGLSFVSLNDEVGDTITIDSMFINDQKVLYTVDDGQITYTAFTDTTEDVPMTVSKLVLPLDYFDTATTFVFGFGDDNDTLKLSYDVQVQYVSEDCGERYVLSKLQAEGIGIDSLRIVSDKPGNSASSKNIEIYLE